MELRLHSLPSSTKRCFRKKVRVTVEADTMVVVEIGIVSNAVFISVADGVSVTRLLPGVVEFGVETAAGIHKHRCQCNSLGSAQSTC